MLYQLSYGPLTAIRLPSMRPIPLRSFSGQGRNRTTDTTIFSRVLYQLSYLARYLARTRVLPPTEKKSARPFGGGRLGEGCSAPDFLEAPLDGPPSRARPRIRHRKSSGLLRIGPEHQ